MRVEVDVDRCIGSLGCEETCPEVFKVLGGVSQVLVEVVPPEAEQRCLEAARNCPSGAIRVVAD